MIKNVLSYLGGYFNSNTFELDIPKIVDASEFTEEEIIQELKKLQLSGDIKLDKNNITLINIKAKKNKEFNDLYKPVEIIDWVKGTKLKLDV